jgi:hypothetical protein
MRDGSLSELVQATESALERDILKKPFGRRLGDFRPENRGKNAHFEIPRWARRCLRDKKC